jgi:putative endonuclease
VPSSDRADRAKREDRARSGQQAELAVADYLVASGYRVLARNLRLGALELDVVAQKGDVVAVVEVRTRGPGSLAGPFESVTGAKRARLRRAVQRLWRERLSAMKDVRQVRIDVAAVTFEAGRTRVEYVEDALGGA